MDSKKYWIGTEKSVNNSANSAGAARPTNKGNGALAPGHPWAFKLGNNPLKNPSISAVTAEQSRPRVVVRLADEMASHLMPSGCGPIEKSGRNSTNSTIDPYLEKSGKNSTNSTNSMPSPEVLVATTHRLFPGCISAVEMPSKCRRNAVNLNPSAGAVPLLHNSAGVG
jgi:hypothetical protein